MRLLLQMVLETKSGLEGAVIGGGHSVAAARLDAQRSVAGWVSEQMGGLSYLFYIRDLVSHPHLHLESSLSSNSAYICFQQLCALCYAVCAMQDLSDWCTDQMKQSALVLVGERSKHHKAQLQPPPPPFPHATVS